MEPWEFEHYIASVLVFFLLIIVLVIQIQVSRNTKSIEKRGSEIHKIVENILKKMLNKKVNQ
ncbi:MAG: hypothetical protein JW976_13085 [Syntrophaceae bacterium]|nr:hypothetical protein [Syntrophaceae bacterium]